MSAQVDPVRGEVTAGGRSWRFDLDCRHGTAAIEFGGARVRLHPHSWREKRILARFAHLGEGFLKDQFVRICLDETAAVPDDGPQREALLALALWINAPGGEPALPLDQRVLAAVTVQVCHAIQAPPGALDGLDAADVELLWRAARGEATRPAENEPESTRIVIVPDHPPVDPENPAAVEPENAAIPVESRPQPTISLDAARPAPAATAPAGPAVQRPAAASTVETPSPREAAPAAPSAGSDGGDGRRAPMTVPSPLRGGRFRVSLDTMRPVAPAPSVVAEGPARPRAVPAPLEAATAPARAEPPSRSWPWPVTGTVALAASPFLATPDTDGRGAASARVGPAPRSTTDGAARGAPSGASEPVAGVLGIADPLFDELAARLEQAAGELGIDLEG